MAQSEIPKEMYTMGGRGIKFTLQGLLHIAEQSGQLIVQSSWHQNETGYALSIRKDTGKRLETMFIKGMLPVGHLMSHYTHLAQYLQVCALRKNLETHFEYEIELVRKELMK